MASWYPRAKLNLFGLAIVLALCFASTSEASDRADYSRNAPNKKEARKVVGAVQKYASAISCSNVKVNARKIAVLIPYSSNDSKYAVLWDGDIGCSGTNGNDQTHIAIVGIGVADTFVVDPLASSPTIRFDSPAQFVDKIVVSDPRSLVLEGKVEGPNDALCCPSVRLRFTLRADDNQNWVLVEKHVIQR
jgi:hypothetical protein